MNALKLAVIILVTATQMSVAYALSKGTSHIGITKVASLQISDMDTDQFYTDNSSNQMSSSACLQTGGAPVPYRVSATSLNGKNHFAATNEARHSQMGYDVIWSHDEDKFRFNSNDDVSDVIQAEAGVGCDNHTLSIEMDAGTFTNASAATHTDTLSLIFVIE